MYDWAEKMLTDCRIKHVQEQAANMTAETARAAMSPEEAKRLSRVRNIGIAVRSHVPPLFMPR